MKKRFLLLSLVLLTTSCVTKTFTLDGTQENVDIDNVKLSDTYVNLALEYQKHNAPQIALERVNLAIKTNSRNARAYMVRGMVYASLNKSQNAEADFKKAISLQSDFSDAYVNYGSFLCQIGRYQEADQNFDKALDNPLYYNPEIGYFDKGECYLKQTNYDKASAAFLKSLTYKNPPANSYLSLAKLQYAQQNYVLAKFYIDKFNGEQSPASLWLHIQIIQAILDNNLAPNLVKENTSYRNTLAMVLLDNYSDSVEAQNCLMKYGNVVNKNNLIKFPPRGPVATGIDTTTPGFTMLKPTSNTGVSSSTPATVAPKNNIPKVAVVNKQPPSVAPVNSLSAKSDAALANVVVNTDANGRKYIIVPAGTTMYAVSRKYGISIQQIEKFNNLKITQISKGMRLYIE